ncbi:MAG: prefoldin subunit beta [Candidatus Aenigmatarchaeota archaeon]
MEISEQTQQLIMQFQTYQQHAQAVVAQLEAMKNQLIETESSLSEIEKSKEEHVYKSVGTILVKKPTEEVKKELEERKDLLNIRIEALVKEEKRIGEKIKELQGKIQGEIDRQSQHEHASN